MRDRQRAQLPGPWLSPVALAEEPGGAVDVFGARGPAARQLLGDAADLEVASVAPGAPLDRQAQLAQVRGQLCPVPGAVLAGGAVELARFDRGELAVVALGGEDDEVGVQLGVGNAAGLLVLGEAAGGVDELGGEQALGALEADDPAALAPDEGDLALGSRQSARHRALVGGLDLGASVGTGGRPQRRDRLRRRHHQLDAGDPGAVGARRAQRLAGERREALHHRAQVAALHRLLGVEAE